MEEKEIELTRLQRIIMEIRDIIAWYRWRRANPDLAKELDIIADP